MEVLVVMAIMAIVLAAGVAMLYDDRPGYLLQQEAGRLRQLLCMASDDAVLHGHEWGVFVTPEGYRFVYFDAGSREWVNAAEAPFGDYTLPEPLRLRLSSTGDMKLADDTVSLKHPDILLLSDGQTSVFALKLQIGGDDRSAITLAADGHSLIAPVGEAP